jgi:hypothetical protein
MIRITESREKPKNPQFQRQIQRIGTQFLLPELPQKKGKQAAMHDHVAPHDMIPVYKRIFGITTEDLKNKKFLSRLRRSGLGKPK